MATVQELSDALVKADAAGDTQGATVLANALKQQQSLGAQLPSTEPQSATPALDAFKAKFNQNYQAEHTPPATQSAVPILDNLTSYANSAVKSIPVVGTSLDRIGNVVDSTINNLIPGMQHETPEDRASQNAAVAASHPVASALGEFSGPAATYGILGAAAPELFGMQEGGAMLPKVAASAASTFGLTTADNVSRGQNVGDAAKSAILPSVLAAGTPVVGSLVRKIITPNPISAAQMSLNDIMKQEGVNLTAGQQTGKSALKYAESELGGGGAADMMAQQKQQFTQAALAKAGITADRATPEVLKQHFDTLGQQFDRLGANNTLIPDRQMGADIRTAWTDYQNIAGSDAKPIIGNSIQDIANWAKSGQITGEQYQALRSRLGRALNSTSSPELKGALGDIQEALDGAMERSIAANNPNDLGAWKQTRRDYANLMTLKDAASGAGEDAALGLISPAKLRQAVAARNGKAYVTGQGDFADLARAGVGTMAPLPQSGTAPRTLMHVVPAALGSIVGGILGHGAEGATLGTLGGLAAPAIAGKALMSPWVQHYLTNQALASPAAMGPASTALQAAARGLAVQPAVQSLYTQLMGAQ